MEIQGQVAIVTGGAIRIGRALVESLLDAGANVVCHYGSSKDAASELVKKYGSDRVELVQADLSRPIQATERIINASQQKFGTATILINCAAIFETGSLEDTDEDHWDRHFDINLKSPFFLAQQFVKQCPSSERGHIINIVDWRGLRPKPGHVAYTMGKAALVAMTRELAIELGPEIQVNAIAPGAILPPPGESNDYLLERVSHVPLKRHGGPADIVKAALYLLTSDFVTGEVMHVTGGEQL